MLPDFPRLRSLNSAAYTVTIVFAIVGLSTFKTTAQTPSLPKNNSTPIGCLSGYPDGTFQGDRPITRYEFVAGLNACLEQFDQNIRSNNPNLATKEDFETLIQRQRELNRELHQLNERTSNPTLNKSLF
jgi:S-layer homology domain